MLTFSTSTTFHVLTILLHRAFLEQGHLRRHSNDAGKRRGEEACVRSALMIQKYVRMYRNAFTLRRAPFLLSYAVYSSVTVILHQEQQNRGQFTDTISFFWSCLHELQRGCNFGLKKPLSILRDMAHELRVRIEEGSFTCPEQQLQPTLDQSLFSNAFSIDSGRDARPSSGLTPQTPGSSGGNGFFVPDYPIDGLDVTYAPMPTKGLDFLNDQEKNISHDALYGLFAPTQHFS